MYYSRDFMEKLAQYPAMPSLRVFRRMTTKLECEPPNQSAGVSCTRQCAKTRERERGLQVFFSRASFGGIRRGLWEILQHHRPRGGVGRQRKPAQLPSAVYVDEDTPATMGGRVEHEGALLYR